MYSYYTWGSSICCFCFTGGYDPSGEPPETPGEISISVRRQEQRSICRKKNLDRKNARFAKRFSLMTKRGLILSIKNWMGPYERTPKEVARAIRYSGLGVHSVGPVGDFLDSWCKNHTVDGSNPETTKDDDYPKISIGFHTSTGGCWGFLPSTVFLKPKGRTWEALSDVEVNPSTCCFDLIIFPWQSIFFRYAENNAWTYIIYVI